MARKACGARSIKYGQSGAGGTWNAAATNGPTIAPSAGHAIHDFDERTGATPFPLAAVGTALQVMVENEVLYDWEMVLCQRQNTKENI